MPSAWTFLVLFCIEERQILENLQSDTLNDADLIWRFWTNDKLLFVETKCDEFGCYCVYKTGGICMRHPVSHDIL